MNVSFRDTLVPWFLISVCIGILLYHYAILPIIIDNRANDLGLMQYSHEAGKMVPTEEFKWTLHYLKYGSMK